MTTEDLEWERSKISNQDMNLLKRLGFTKKKDALRFPHEESYPSPPIEYRLQLTPNSILHVSIFITLCECFPESNLIGLRGNASSASAVMAPTASPIILAASLSVFAPTSITSTSNSLIPPRVAQRWLYVHEESSDSMEYIAPFDGKTKILRRLAPGMLKLPKKRSWRQSADDSHLSKKSPLDVCGDEDVERLSTDLSAKDLEKLIRRISKLSKKDTVPSSCKVKPFCSANPLPEGHLVLSSLPPLPEGGEVEERAVVTDDNQGASRPESGVGGSQKSAASLEKENETEVTSSTRSSLPATSPIGKRKRDETIDSGASKADTSRAEKAAPTAGEKPLALYDAALISS
ncbi:hypothetical protein QYE76_023241 [Lolium multiflorum]|uniref:Uncharacterized protein n=1 Tax=Lolium multiflorum TaxID=4521 RepID=A0AAD8RCX6_LOLMU|nr:hypothetical protein QYE76_023241 [Lolium multiflorum]